VDESGFKAAGKAIGWLEGDTIKTIIQAYLDTCDPWCYDMDEAPRDGRDVFLTDGHGAYAAAVWSDEPLVSLGAWLVDDIIDEDGELLFAELSFKPRAFMKPTPPKQQLNREG